MNKKDSLVKKYNSVAMGAAFLMAMAAVGPGFLTQTATFTGKLGASFGFAIILCILVDIIVQLNIWRVIVVSGKRAQVIANQVFPGLGFVLSILVAVGGFVFNIGNIGGAGLGLNVLFGIAPENGAIILAAIVIIIFIVKNALKTMDRFVQILAVVKVLIIIFILIVAKVPYHTAVVDTFHPKSIDFYSIVTIIGGTVGGYISFTGGHRLLDGGVKGTMGIKYVRRGVLSGVSLASIIRIMLFLAGLAVVVSGATLDPNNPAGSIFLNVAGEFGYKFFGLLLFASGMTSTLGSTFTSVSFLDYSKTNYGESEFNKYRSYIIVGYLLLATLIFYFIGNPANVLVIVGAINGFILPIALAILLVATQLKKVVGKEYHHPLWLSITGWLVVIFMFYAGFETLVNTFFK